MYHSQSEVREDGSFAEKTQPREGVRRAYTVPIPHRQKVEDGGDFQTTRDHETARRKRETLG